MVKDPEASKILFWLHSIQSRARSVSVFIVGTHLDDPRLSPEVVAYKMAKLEKYQSKLSFFFQLIVFRTISYFAHVFQMCELCYW